MSRLSAASRHRNGSSGNLPTVSRQQLDALRQRVATNLAARRAEAARRIRPVVHYDEDFFTILALLAADA
jgi:hypothetical protein